VEEIQRRRRLKVFWKRWWCLGADFLVKKGVIPIYPDREGGGILEKKYLIQRISWQQEGGKVNEIKNPGCNKEHSLDHNRSEINKIMRLVLFKMEGTPILEQLIMKNYYAISYNLKETYNHVPMHLTMQDLLVI
jgi:hypothetical protein